MGDTLKGTHMHPLSIHVQLYTSCRIQFFAGKTWMSQLVISPILHLQAAQKAVYVLMFQWHHVFIRHKISQYSKVTTSHHCHTSNNSSFETAFIKTNNKTTFTPYTVVALEFRTRAGRLPGACPVHDRCMPAWVETWETLRTPATCMLTEMWVDS